MRATSSADDRRKRAEAIDHHPRAADEQHDGHHFRRGHEAARDGHDRRERPDRRRLDGMIGAGDDDAPAGFGIVAPIVFTGGQNPRQSRGHGDGGAQQHDRMGKTESRGGIIGGSVSGMLPVQGDTS